jgi:hypothetical protein
VSAAHATPRARFTPLRVLVLRAAVCYLMLRALLLVIALLLVAVAGGGDVTQLGSPAGVVLVATAVGAVDIRRRGESLFWANLGYSPLVTRGLFGVMAVLGEVAIAWIRW